MGVLICSKHGKTGIILTCPHLAGSMDQFQEVSDVAKILERKKDPNDKFGYDKIHYLCKDCDETYKNTDFSEYTDELLEPVCAKCLVELSNLKTWY